MIRHQAALCHLNHFVNVLLNKRWHGPFGIYKHSYGCRPKGTFSWIDGQSLAFCQRWLARHTGLGHAKQHCVIYQLCQWTVMSSVVDIYSSMYVVCYLPILCLFQFSTWAKFGTWHIPQTSAQCWLRCGQTNLHAVLFLMLQIKYGNWVHQN